MIRLFTLNALLLWLANPSCALCCAEGRLVGELGRAATLRELPIPDHCCPGSDEEHGIPSARTCCLLDEHSHDFIHQPTHEPSLGVVVERLPAPVEALLSILPTHQASPDPRGTYLTRSVLLI